MQLTKGKSAHLAALSNEGGVIAAVAMDQRGSLMKAIAKARGCAESDVTPQMLSEFKSAVSRVLSRHASAILLDPEYGLEAAQSRAPGSGLLLAYELTGYDTTQPGRLPDLLPHVSARRIADWGANAVKVLLYYTPFEDAAVNDVKHVFVERVGAECAGLDIPYFLEIITYDHAGADEKGLDYALAKPKIVAGAMKEFSADRYGIDVLKVEVPISPSFTEGTLAFKGQRAYTRGEALRLFREASDACSKPFIYLSAGVGNQEFIELLGMASEAGAAYSGVLCGRATWKGGIQVYASGGPSALEAWLEDEGVRNVQAVNRALTGATSWQQVHA